MNAPERTSARRRTTTSPVTASGSPAVRLRRAGRASSPSISDLNVRFRAPPAAKASVAPFVATRATRALSAPAANTAAPPCTTISTAFVPLIVFVPAPVSVSRPVAPGAPARFCAIARSYPSPSTVRPFSPSVASSKSRRIWASAAFALTVPPFASNAVQPVPPRQRPDVPPATTLASVTPPSSAMRARRVVLPFPVAQRPTLWQVGW